MTGRLRMCRVGSALVLGATVWIGAMTSARAELPPAQEAESLQTRVRDQSLRIETYLKAEDIKRARDAIEDQKADVEQLKKLESSAQQRAKDAPSTANADAVTATKKAVDAATTSSAAATTKVEDAKTRSGCGGTSRVCVFGGAVAGSYSLTWGSGSRAGQTGHHIVSLIVPEAGVRFAAREHISFDVGIYSAIISPELQTNVIDAAGSGCSRTTSKFNDTLPCEGNTVLRPYGAFILGATIGTGNSSIGILTIGYTLGAARTTQDATAFFFQGIIIGTGGVYGTFAI